jgi:hypothetical protein
VTQSRKDQKGYFKVSLDAIGDDYEEEAQLDEAETSVAAWGLQAQFAQEEAAMIAQAQAFAQEEEMDIEGDIEAGDG